MLSSRTRAQYAEGVPGTRPCPWPSGRAQLCAQTARSAALAAPAAPACTGAECIPGSACAMLQPNPAANCHAALAVARTYCDCGNKFCSPMHDYQSLQRTFKSSSYSAQTLLIQRLHQTTHAPPVHKRAGQFFAIIKSTGRSTWRTFFEERCGGAGAARGFAAAAARCCAACAWQSRQCNAPASMAVHHGQVYVCA